MRRLFKINIDDCGKSPSRNGKVEGIGGGERKEGQKGKKNIKSKEVFEVCDETPFLSRDDGE